MHPRLPNEVWRRSLHRGYVALSAKAQEPFAQAAIRLALEITPTFLSLTYQAIFDESQDSWVVIAERKQ